MNSPANGRTIVSASQTLNGTPKDVFPLLCPVREYDWLEEWSCNLISSHSGIAEPNCVFSTKMDYGHAKPREEIWIVSRYEPKRAIEFVKFCDGLYVIKYDIWLSPVTGGKTQARWTQTRTPLSGEGEGALESATQEHFETMIKTLEQKLNYYLETGERLVV